MRWWRRPLDLILVLVTGLPVVIVGALVFVIVGALRGWPIFFVQERPGMGGRPFRLWKFRTMRVGPGPDVDRLDAFGRWLRATSLDELPSWWNVLRGEMSFVGPRPLLMEYLALYSAEQARRMLVLPGITGWAQISGRNGLTWPDRLALDVWYVDHQTFALDCKILVLTIPAVLRRKGIAQPGQATMTPFRGQGE